MINAVVSLVFHSTFSIWVTVQGLSSAAKGLAAPQTHSTF
jgi:hypothetical protein